MKTLDEVIEAERHCIGKGCQGCPYDIVTYGGSCECNEDILHYLKEYRQVTDVMHKLGFCSVLGTTLPDHDKVEEKPDIDGCANPPLTWDELKGMEGKPVWVEYGVDLQVKRWIILPEMRCSYHHDRHSKDVIVYGVIMFLKDEIGKTWQAYRKERE